MRSIKTLEDVEPAIKQLDDRLRIFEAQTIDFHQKRVTNAHPSIDDYDYVVRKELVGLKGKETVVQGGSGDTTINITGGRFFRTIGAGVNSNLFVSVDIAPPLIIGINCTLEKIFFKCKVPPVGADAIADIKLNGSTTILNSSKLTFPAGTSAIVVVSSFVTSSFAENDYLTMDITQIGSTTPGGTFTVHFRFLVN